MVENMLKEKYGIALDIGTTTVVLSLIELNTGKELNTVSELNAQREFGQDILSRITYEYRAGEEAIMQLQKKLVEQINDMLRNVCGKSDVSIDEIKEIVVAANCTMTHMLLGCDARGIGQSPYHPTFINAQTLQARNVGICVNENVLLYCIPQVSAFIGGDVVSGIYVNGLHTHREENSLFLDIGTNGEIVFAGPKGLVACSCAGGPALEGMNISCGMVAECGAIEEVALENGIVSLKVIGDEQPKGICGSGVLAIVRELLKWSIIDETGCMEPEMFWLSREPEVYICAKDVRQIQLAKGALLAGIYTLLQDVQVDIKDIENIYIAGQFGSHLSESILLETGVLPKEAKGKVKYVGNAAKAGASLTLRSDKVRDEMEELAKDVRYVELSNTETYTELFMKSMSFT